MRNIIVLVAFLLAVRLQAATLTLSNAGVGAGQITVTSPAGQILLCNNVTGTGNCTVQIPDAATKITITAATIAGANFSGWTSGSGSTSSCSLSSTSRNPTCTVSIDQNSFLRYTFSPSDANVPLMEVRYVTGSSGQVTGQFIGGVSIFSCTSNCTKNVKAGTVITLSATANSGSSFLGWKNGTGSAGRCSGTAPCRFAIDKASSITATFNTTK